MEGNKDEYIRVGTLLNNRRARRLMKRGDFYEVDMYKDK